MTHTKGAILPGGFSKVSGSWVREQGLGVGGRDGISLKLKAGTWKLEGKADSGLGA